MNNEQTRNRLIKVDRICKTENERSEKFGLSEAKFWEICDPVRRVASPITSKGATIRISGHYFLKTKSGNLACVIKGKWAIWQSHNRKMPGYKHRFIYRTRRIKMYWVYLRVNGIWRYFDRSNYLWDAMNAAFIEEYISHF